MSPEELGRLPTKPGVYLLKDTKGEVLYVGKAKSLRARVRSYFRGRVDSVKTQELVRRVEGVETVVVGSEAEALILEANLIKEHQPRFNIRLRDDKRYPYVKVTLREPFPRVYVTRRVIKDGSRYFGPYTSVGRMRQTLEVVKRLYTVRSCRYDLPRERPDRPCLDYHIGRCKAPCVDLQTAEEYGAMIREILRILGGEVEEVQRDVETRMHEASEDMNFEQAGRLRDVLAGLDGLARRQRVQRVGGGDRDVLGFARDGDVATGVTLKIRAGILLAQDSQRVTGIEGEDDPALMARFATHFYLSRGSAGTAELPGEVLLPADFEDRQLLGEILTDTAGRRIRLHVPQRGDKRRLVDLANQNARNVLEDRIGRGLQGTGRAEDVLFELQDQLELKVVPRLMACFDISHTQGTDTVASAVVFENGEPRRSQYRHMRIRGDWGNDDYRSMQEAVRRYFRRRLEEELPLPDLAVIDGGKGQLGAALSALETLEVRDVAVIALAKREEEVFRPGTPEPVILGKRDRGLHLLQRLRDEAHRFAITYNRKLRRKRTLKSDLSEIPGVGPARQRALLSRFGSVRGVRDATAEEIGRVPGFSHVLASRILTYLAGR